MVPIRVAAIGGSRTGDMKKWSSDESFIPNFFSEVCSVLRKVLETASVSEIVSDSEDQHSGRLVQPREA